MFRFSHKIISLREVRLKIRERVNIQNIFDLGESFDNFGAGIGLHVGLLKFAFFIDGKNGIFFHGSYWVNPARSCTSDCAGLSQFPAAVLVSAT